MSGVLWKLNRLRLMSFSELLFRCFRYLAQKHEKYRLAYGWVPFFKGKVKGKNCLFGENESLINDWNSKYKINKTQLNNYIEGKIDFFGHESMSVGNPVNWHRDPVSQIVSPKSFGKELNYRDDNIVGNVKFIWELGRHQHLVPLSVAYAVTGEIHYKQAVVNQIDSWIRDNPYGLGIHWCSSLEAALRLISWALVHSFLALRDKDNGLFSAINDPEILGQSIYQHAYFIRHFLSRYSSANNHLIGELSGLWIGCQVFDLGEYGTRWSKFAQKELEHESKLQVYVDGVDKEQAFYYHLWVLEYFFFIWLAGIRTKTAFSEEFLEKVKKMTYFLKDVSPDGGDPPQIGDADDGFVARFEPCWSKMPYTELLNVLDYVFDDAKESVPQKAFWYRSILSSIDSTSSKLNWERSYPAEYREGGYVMLGGAGCHLVFDCGSLGYQSIAAHGHADALNICLAIDGQWWLVDPGTYAYHSDEEWRNYFRGTSAHNTVMIDGENQSTIGGPFMWTLKAKAGIEKLTDENGLQIATAFHDGYKKRGVIHHRKVSYSQLENMVEITDSLQGGDHVKAEIFFHFSPEVSLQYDEVHKYWIATRENSDRRVMFVFGRPWEVGLIKGQYNPILGWYSSALEEKIESSVLHGISEYSGSQESLVKVIIK